MSDRPIRTLMWSGAPAAVTPGRALPAGVLLGGRYRIERRLGEGRVGPVVLARSVQDDQVVAVKLLRAPQAGEEGSDGSTWFLREARSAARVESDFAARVMDSGTLDGASYLVMEYLEGPTFTELLEKRRRLPVQLAVTYALQAIEGLAAAHALGIVHRDIKPSNLFLARRTTATAPRVVLADFAIANCVYPPGASMEADGARRPRYGSPRWMAPEQIRASSDVDRRSDLFSLGAVIYEMLAGGSPFGDGPPQEVCARVLHAVPAPLRALRPEVPETLEAAVMQCLEKDPRHRFKNVAALARALALAGTPGARKTAEHIARIGAKIEEHEGVLEESTPGTTPPVLPEASLTDTSYGRAIAGIELLVRGPRDSIPDAVVEGERVERLPGGGHGPLGTVRMSSSAPPPPPVVMTPVVTISSTPPPVTTEPPRAPSIAPANVPTLASATLQAFPSVPFPRMASTAPRPMVPPLPYRPVDTPGSFFASPPPKRRRMALMPVLVGGAAAAVGLALFIAGRLQSDDPSPTTSADTTAMQAPAAPPSAPPAMAAPPAAPAEPPPGPAQPSLLSLPPPPPGAAPPLGTTIGQDHPASTAPPRAGRRGHAQAAASQGSGPADAPIGTAGFGGRE
ncbi:MAG TPA: serine/threonine-protein kinase [Polyangiaceae bacterium]|jgi:serine/threonine-protein kinase|nr:serine/threonine-protein kinase [Polyangiaceae bacterium]